MTIYNLDMSSGLLYLLNDTFPEASALGQAAGPAVHLRNSIMKILTQAAVTATTLLLSSCDPLGGATATEGGPTTVSGQVLSSPAGQPVPRPPRVQLWQRPQATGSGGGLGGGAAYTPAGDPHPTDALGRFRFSFPALAKHEYILRADEAGLGYFTDWALAPALQGGHKNEDLRLPVYAPVWIQLDLVDEAPRSRIRIFFSGFGGGHQINYPRDTAIVFPYLSNQESFIYWRITNERGQETTDRRTFTIAPLDTQRVRIAF